MSTANKPIDIAIEGDGVATVTLTRPEKHNAFDDEIINTLTTAFIEIEQNQDVKVMILAAQGKSFSAGADLSWMKRMADYSYAENQADAMALATMLKTLNNLSKPTIARVQGGAYGGAVGLVSCCDMAVGTPAAKFCLSEVRLGLVPATISPYVINAIGSRAARRYFLTAETITADQALHLGLLSTVASEQELNMQIRRFCDALLSNGKSAIATSKKLISDVAGQSINEALIAHTSSVIAEARVSEEAQQRLSKFLDRRDGGRKPKKGGSDYV